MPRTGQTSFGTGELDPSLHGRVDIARYLQAVALARNWLVKPQGGLANRPGTRVVAATKGNARTRLLPFQRSSQETAVLQLAEGSLRFVTYGSQVTVEPTDAAVSNGGFDLSIAGWGDYSGGSALIRGAGSVLLVAPAVGTPIGNMTAGGGLGAAFDGVYGQASSAAASRTATTVCAIGKSWGGAGPKKIGRFVLDPTPDRGFMTGTGLAFDVRLEGSSDDFASDIHTLFAASAQDDQRNIDVDASVGLDASTAYAYHRVRLFTSGAAQSFYISEVEFYEVTSGNGSLELVSAADGIAATEQPIATTKLGQEHVLAVRVIGTQGQSCKVMIGGSSNTEGILPRLTLLPGWHLIPFSPGVSPFYLRFFNPNADTVAIDDVALLGSGASAAVPLELGHDYREGDLRAIYHAESVDVVTLDHPSHPPRELRRLGPRQWSLIDMPVAPTQQPPTGLGITRTGTGSTDYYYVVTAQGEGGEESLASDEVTIKNAAALAAGTNTNTVTWAAPAGAFQYSVYKYRNGLYGFIGSTTELTFTDDGINAAVSQTPPAARNPFDAPGKYPAALDYYEQRQVHGGSTLAPDTNELSKAAAFRNYSKAVPTQSDDAITFTAASGEVNRIVGYAQLTDLLIFTTGSYWRLSRGQGGLTPQLEGGVKMQAAVGAAPLKPIVLKNVAVFVSDKGQGVHSAAYDYSTDTYQPTELSLLARHLLEGRQVVEWAYQRTPWPIVWQVRDDGVMLALTYLAEQQVTGWTWHDTRGQWESVACVSEGDTHALYVVVRRYLGGSWHRYVERFAARIVQDVRDAFHVDCGVTAEQASGVTAVALADPFVVTAPGHGSAVGDLVELAGIMADPYPPTTGDLAAMLNNQRFLVQAVSGDDLTLADKYAGGTGPDGTTPALDATGWPVWLGGGKVRRCFSAITATHLAGETVALLVDGNVQEPRVVAPDGTVTLDGPAARAHVGLPYLSDMQTLDMALPPDQAGQRKRVTEVLATLNSSRGLKVGPTFSDLIDPPAREAENWDDPAAPITGLVRITTPSMWSDGGRMCWRQDQPLPAEILSVVPDIEIGG